MTTTQTPVTDKRKNKTEGLGTAAAVQTSTLKPRDMGAGLAAFFREGDTLKLHPGDQAVAALAEKGLEIVKQTGSGWIVAKIGEVPPEPEVASTEGRATGTVVDPDRFCPACGDALFVHGDLLKCSAGSHTLGPEPETLERAIGFWAAARMQHAAGRSVEEAAARLWCDADDRMSAKWVAWTEEANSKASKATEGSRSDPGGSPSDPPAVPEPPPSPLAPTEPPPALEASAAPAAPVKRKRGRPRKNPPAEAQDRAVETGPPAPSTPSAVPEPMPTLEVAERMTTAPSGPSAAAAGSPSAVRALEPEKSKRPYTPPAVESTEPRTTREQVYAVEPLTGDELQHLGGIFLLSIAFGVTVEEADRRVREATLALRRTVLRPYPEA